MTPSCSLVDPRMTRTSRARIRPFTRICDCRLNQSSWPATREVNRGAVFIFPQLLRAPSLATEHFCLTTPADAAVTGPPFREPTGSSRQQSFSSKVNLPRLGGDERLSPYDVEQGDFVNFVGDIFNRVRHWPSDEEKGSGEECQFGMF